MTDLSARKPEQEELSDNSTYHNLIYSKSNQIYAQDLLLILSVLKEHITKTDFNPASPISILDVGSGEGILDIQLMSKLGKQYNLQFNLLDPSSQELSQAEHNFNAAGKKVNLYNTSIENATFNQTFDLIICTRVLHHCLDASKSIEKMYSFGKPGSLLYLSDLIRPQTEEELQQRLHKRLQTLNDPASQYLAEKSIRSAFTLEEVQTLLVSKSGKLATYEDWFQHWYFCTPF